MEAIASADISTQSSTTILKAPLVPVFVGPDAVTVVGLRMVVVTTDGLLLRFFAANPTKTVAAPLLFCTPNWLYLKKSNHRMFITTQASRIRKDARVEIAHER